MKDPSKRDWRLGVKRLLSQLRDLDEPAGELRHDNVSGLISIAHRSLFKTYLSELEKVVHEANADWNTRVDGWAKQWNSHDRALEHMWTERPAGPSSHRDLVKVVRHYWLQCVKLNQEVDQSERVAPETFILVWVIAEGKEEEVRVLAYMPYWPLGQDDDGNWV